MNAALERKLRPIYDCIDQGDLKRAQKLVKALAAKQKSPIVHAVRALVLQRLGQHDEAYDIVRQIKSEKPTDLPLIEILVHVYRGLGRMSEVLELFEILYAANPNEENEKVLMQSYLGTRNFEKLYKLGLKKFTETQQVKYGVFAVQSDYIKAVFNPEAAKTLMISGMLLQKLMAATEDKQYLNFLSFKVNEAMGNAAKSLEILQEHPEIVDNLVDRSLLLADMFIAKGDKLSALQSLSEPLRNNLSIETALPCWNVYKRFVEILFSLENQPDSEAALAHTGDLYPDFTQLDEAEAFKAGIYSVMQASEALKEPDSFSISIRRLSDLAKLEILLRLYPNANSSSLQEEINRYISLYFVMPSTPDDLIPYLRALSSEQIPTLVQSATKFLESLEQNTVAYERAYITVYKISRLVDASTQTKEQVIEVYKKSLETEPEPKKGEHRK